MSMDTDIHLMVEKRKAKEGWFRDYKQQPNGELEKELRRIIRSDSEWHSCSIMTYRRPWGNRHYEMFAKLANVGIRDGIEIKPLPLRGFPEDACVYTFFEYALEVIPDSARNDGYGVGYGYSLTAVPESRADEWVKEGCSKEIMPPNVHWPDRRFITSPSYNSPNWCTSQELEEAIKEIFYEEAVGDYVQYASEWLGLLYYMKGLEAAGYETRCVFWFDN